MRKPRVSFAAPFVMVVGTLATGCGPAKSPTPVHDNPPGPTTKTTKTVQECQALVDGSACVGDESCKTDPDCPSGFECRDSKWTRIEVACNPPPPQ